MTTIIVTQYDIDHGQKGNACACPVALASYRVFNKINEVEEDRMWRNGEEIMLPMKARNFIDRFDSGKPVKPFSFRVR